MGDMDDMEDFEGLVGEDGKPFLCFCWFLLGMLLSALTCEDISLFFVH
jgi:hypothetical protein